MTDLTHFECDPGYEAEAKVLDVVFDHMLEKDRKGLLDQLVNGSFVDDKV